MTAPDELRALIDARNARSIHAALDVEVRALAPDVVVFTVPVTDKLRMHGGVVHGGVYALLGEGACSTLSALHTDLRTHVVAGQEINANHLRSVSEGELVCTARPIHVVGSTHVVGFEVRTDEGELVSVGRCTVAVRPRKAGD